MLASSGEDGEPVALPVSVLPRLDLDDVPEGVSYEVGTVKDGALHLDWSGRMIREGGRLVGEAVHTWTRKYWCSQLGLEQYLDLVSRAVETRHRVRDDVALTDYDDDSAYVMLRFRMETGERNSDAPTRQYARSWRKWRWSPNTPGRDGEHPGPAGRSKLGETRAATA